MVVTGRSRVITSGAKRLINRVITRQSGPIALSCDAERTLTYFESFAVRNRFESVISYFLGKLHTQPARQLTADAAETSRRRCRFLRQFPQGFSEAVPFVSVSGFRAEP